MYLHSRLTIHAKILIGYSALLLLLATVGGIGWYGSQLVGHQSEELYHEHLQGTVTLATAESTLWELRWGLVQYMVVGEAEQAQIVRDQEGLYRQLDKALADYGTTDLGPEERAAFAKLQQAVAQYVASRPRFFQLMSAGQQEEAGAWRAQTTTRYGK